MKAKRGYPFPPSRSSSPRKRASALSETVNGLLQSAMDYHRAGQLSQAGELYERILQLSPNDPDALHLQGLIAGQRGQHQTAIELIERSIKINSRNASAYNNLGNEFRVLKQYEAALELYSKAIRLNPDYADAFSNRGNVLQEIKQYQSALESYEKAIILKPGLAEAYNNRGNALRALRRHQAALESFDKAILINREYADAYTNRGNVLQELKQYAAALEDYDKAILLNPQNVEAYSNRGNAFQELKLYPAALENYKNALFFSPDYEYLHGRLLFTKRRICDWSNHESECKQLEIEIDHGERVAKPFDILAFVGSPSLQRKVSELYVQDRHPSRSTSTPIPRRSRHDKIRIGYFSADYHNHATCYLMAELFELHDKSKFEIFGFSFGPDAHDEMRQRITAAMDRLIDVRSMSDREVALLSRELEVDIAVDLKGFTQDNRTEIFAERAAPIQVNYLGYPGTMGTPHIDYLIADRTVIPENSQHYYSEKITYLPDSYQVNSNRHISAKRYTRTDEGLPETGFVYCCFNDNYKITPGMFDLWMRILGRVKNSVLWLLEDNVGAASNLRREAAARGISPQRLIFADRRSLPEHLARLRLADLFLDTLPCNAHTTASDALWAGLPVLTCMGEAFAGRVAASLLRAIRLPELIVTTQEAYEAFAVELAIDPCRCSSLKAQLQHNRLSTPLFDAQAFTRHIEGAFTTMYERYIENAPPENISIECSSN